MVAYVLGFLLLMPAVIFSQSLKQISIAVDSADAVTNVLVQKESLYQAILDSAREANVKVEFPFEPFDATIAVGCYMLAGPTFKSQTVADLSYGDRVKCFGLTEKYFRIERGNLKGYILREAIRETNDAVRVADKARVNISGLEDSLEIVRTQKDMAYRALDSLKTEQEKVERLTNLRRKYGKSRFFRSILDEQIRIGMSKEMVADSWGEPQDINRTVGEWGVHEQWVYGSSYLYFENGKLTSFQD